MFDNDSLNTLSDEVSPSTHKHYCGIDLHARSMYVCLLDQSATILVHKNLPTTPEAFLRIIAPYREDLVVAVECIFTWDWPADLGAPEKIAFVLGHALYMKAIHGGKAKNDKIATHKIAVLLRGGMLPQAYVYPPQMRATRALLRCRCHLMCNRAELLAHIQNTNSQYNLPAFGKKLAYKGNREGVEDHFPAPSVRKSMEVDVALIAHYDQLLNDLELSIARTAKQHDVNAFYRLRSVPGIGKILALVILYEVQDIARFPCVQDFVSYCRVVKCAKESAGKQHGLSGKKIGKVPRKWAFSEAAVLFLRHNQPGKDYFAKLERKHGKGKALTVLAHKLAPGVNTLTGEGLAEALTDAQVVVDVANSPSFEDEAVLEFFETSGRNLLAAEAAAGVGHHVALSVVGTERLLASGYFRAKMAQENLIKASPIPYTIVHATQFFEFVGAIAQSATEGQAVRLSPALVQPVVSDDVAAALADVAVEEPLNGTIELARPEPIRLDDLVRRFLSATRDARKVTTDVHALYFGTELNDQSLTPGAHPRIGPTRFEDWLSHWLDKGAATS